MGTRLLVTLLLAAAVAAWPQSTDVRGAALGEAPKKTAIRTTFVSWSKADATCGEVTAFLGDKGGVSVSIAPELAKRPWKQLFDNVPFWTALQMVADREGARIVVSDGGRKVALVPRGKALEVATGSGPFRIAVTRVVARTAFETGETLHDVHLLVHWEPQVRVFRMSTAPKVTTATDTRGMKAEQIGAGASWAPADATFPISLTLSGLTGRSEQIAVLTGTFKATAADRMLAFAFQPADGKLPAEQKADGVTATLKRVQKKGDVWEIAIEVTYPPGQPEFVSFEGEWWLRDNRLVLRSPAGTSVEVVNREIQQPDNPYPLVAIYQFQEDAAKGFGNPTGKGWSIIYETPAPMSELIVPFELKNIPLP